MPVETVRSADGTTIAFSVSGEGVPLLMIGGGLSDRTAVGPLLPQVEPHFSVYAMDRRGRGDSGDTPPYRTGKEIEDVAAVLDHMARPAFVYGHSSGAMLSLLAAQSGLAITRLAVYEPPYIVDGQRARPAADLADQLTALMASGEPDKALRVFLREAPVMSDAEIDQLQATPTWSAWLSLVHTASFDAQLAGDCTLPRERLANLDTPTLVLVGGASPGWMRAGTEALAEVLPSGQLVVLEGQTHRAHPDVLAGSLIDWFEPGRA